jgi:NhaP-type Na+/H+ or K+/H+ antiporter
VSFDIGGGVQVVGSTIILEFMTIKLLFNRRVKNGILAMVCLVVMTSLLVHGVGLQLKEWGW